MGREGGPPPSQGPRSNALASARALFDPNPDWAYLDTATFGLPPRSALEAMRTAETTWQRGDADWEAWDAGADAARADFAALIGAAADEIALLPSISIGTGLVAASLESGAKVVTPIDEYSSVILPLLVAQERGIDIREVPLETVADAIEPGTALVAVSSIQMQTGRAADLAAITARARDAGAAVLVDATQGVPFHDLRPVIDGIDYLVCAAYKHLLAPHGCAFFRVRRDRWAGLPALDANWRASIPGAPEVGGPLLLRPTAARFDTSLASLPWVAATESIRLVRDWRESGALDEVRRLSDRLADGLGLARPASSLVCFRPLDPEAAMRSLADAGIRAALRHGYVRLAPHVWTTDADVERAVVALRGQVAGEPVIRSNGLW